MKRWIVPILLLLSLGMNVGILATIALSKARRSSETRQERPAATAEAPDRSRSHEGGREERRSEGREQPRDQRRRGRDALRSRSEVRVREQFEALRRRVRRMAAHLELDDQQTRQFAVVQRRLIEATLRERHEIGSLERRIGREISAGEPDPERVSELLEELAKARHRLDRAFAESVIETRKFLDPEQEKKFLRVVGRLRR